MSTWVTLNRTCNLRCKWCYARNTGYKISDNISFEDFRNIADFVKSCGDDQILLIGGEPTLYSKLIECIEYCNSIDIQTVLVTNGVLLTNRELVEKYKKAGLSSIDISIKGASDVEYEGSCGFKKYNDVLVAVKNCSDIFKDQFSCSFVITLDNVDYFINAVRTVCEEGCYRVNLSFAYDFNTSRIKNKYWIYADDPLLKISKFMDHVDEIDEYTEGRWGFELGYPICFYTEEQLKKLGKHMSSCCQLIENSAMLFDTELNSIPCNMMYELKCGKFGQDFINKIEYETNKRICYKHIYDALRALPDERCQKCSNLKYCGGGCVCLWTNTSFKEFDKYCKLKKMPPNYGDKQINQEVDYIEKKISTDELKREEIYRYLLVLKTQFARTNFLKKLKTRNVISDIDDALKLYIEVKS